MNYMQYNMTHDSTVLFGLTSALHIFVTNWKSNRNFLRNSCILSPKSVL